MQKLFTETFYKKNSVLLSVVFFFLVNFLLKILFISRNEIAMDEPFSIYYAQMDLPSVFRMLKTENNPPLHFILLHYWIKLFGTGPFAVRFLSLLFSSMTASVLFMTGSKFFSNRTGIVAALIFTFSTFHVYFSHEARVYPLFVMLTAFSLHSFFSVMKSPEKRGPYLTLFIVNALLIYAHYFGFFVLATELVSLLFTKANRRIWKRMLVVFILLMISYIPNILIFIERFSVSVEHGTWVRKPEITELYGNLNRFLNSKTVMIILLVIALIYTVLLLRERRFFRRLSELAGNPYQRILLIWFAFPYLGMFLLSFRAPMFLDRYIIYISVSFYLLIAVFLTEFNRDKTISSLAAGLFLFVMLISLNLKPDNNRRVDRVVQVINDLKTKDRNAYVIISPDYSYLEFTYHYNINYFKDYKNTLSLLNQENIYPLNDFSSFDKMQIESRKVIYLDCDTYFAFGRNPVLSELSSSHIQILMIPVFEIYKIYWFRNRS